MRTIRSIRAAVIIPSIVLGIFISFPLLLSAQTAQEKKIELQSQIEALETEARELDSVLQNVAEEKKTLSSQVSTLTNDIKRRELEIRRLALAEKKAGIEIEQKNATVAVLSTKIERSRGQLAASLSILNTYDQEDLLTIFLKHTTLSSFFNAVDGLKRVQAVVQDAMGVFRQDRERIEEEKEQLEIFKQDQQDLQAFQIVERRFLSQKKSEKDELLRVTKGKEAVFQQLLSAKKRDIAAIRTQLFYLEKTGITAEDALHFAELAAKRAGIRPAFLLALLEVETGKQFEEGVISVGSNLGTGNWKDDMYLCYQRLGKYYSRVYGSSSYITKYNQRAEREKNAFFSITEKLGLDPEKMPVSKEPRYIGCGGAMGPAQFIPTTWKLYEKKVAALTGNDPPNPWNVEDAFTASAVYLAEGGATAKTEIAETRAAKIYLSGSASCSTAACRWYASRILALARDIEKIL